MACEDTIGMITVQHKTVKKGKVFLPNEQYCFKSKETRLKGCGCGGRPKKEVTFYTVEVDGVNYELSSNYVFESSVPIPREDQNSDRPFTVGNIDGSYQDLLIKPDPAAIRRSANDIPM